MSDSEASARPRQLTMAGWFVVVGSVMLVITVFSSVAGLNSVDTRDRVEEFLSTPTGEGLGLSVSEVLSLLRAVLMVTGVCAAAAAVFGVFVLQRHRGARIGLTVVAVPILIATLLTAPLTGGLLGALVVAATVVLWTGPARDWFAGRPVRQPAARSEPPRAVPPPRAPVDPGHGASPEQAPGPSATEVSTQSPSSLPAATPGYGQAPVGAPPGQMGGQMGGQVQQQWAPPAGAPVAWQPPVAGPVPTPVRIACLLTWVFAGSIAAVYAVMLLVLLVASDQVVDYVLRSPEWQRADLDRDLLVPVLWVGCLMFLGWSVGALLLAWFTWRRHNWARYLLVGSAATAVLAGLVAFPFSLFHVLACVLTIAALFSARSRAWFAQPTGGGYWPPQGPPQGSPQGPPYGSPPEPPPPSSTRSGQGKPPVW